MHIALGSGSKCLAQESRPTSTIQPTFHLPLPQRTLYTNDTGMCASPCASEMSHSLVQPLSVIHPAIPGHTSLFLSSNLTTTKAWEAHPPPPALRAFSCNPCSRSCPPGLSHYRNKLAMLSPDGVLALENLMALLQLHCYWVYSTR
jgi:hypothetical protein